MTMVALLRRAAESRGTAPAVALGRRVLHDHRGLAERAARIAGGLVARHGLVPGDRVAIVAANCPEYFELLFGAWQAGLLAVPVNAKLHLKELGYILAHSGARICFAGPAQASAVAEAAAEAPGLAAILPTSGGETQRLLEAETLATPSLDPDWPAWLFYTSGTTGRPKGAVLSHRSLMTMCLCYFLDIDRIEPGEAILHAAPLSHGSGMYALPHLAAAACQVVPESGGFEPEEMAGLLAHWPGTSLFAAPTMIARLVASGALGPAALAGLKTIVWGGAPMHVADIERALEALGPRLAQLYGQGESPMTITALSKAEIADRAHPDWRARLATAGRPQTAMQVRIADEAGRPLPRGETGEILAKGDALMSSYWRDPEATAAALKGGWLHTGDLGSLDASGYLTLKDRGKDLIISGGANIYPREVEEVLLRHPGIAECAVIGRPHAEWGEEVVAYLVPRDPAARPSTEALEALCLDNIARFKRPRAWRFLESLPKNNYGKILKTDLRQREAATHKQPQKGGSLE